MRKDRKNIDMEKDLEDEKVRIAEGLESYEGQTTSTDLLEEMQHF